MAIIFDSCIYARDGKTVNNSCICLVGFNKDKIIHRWHNNGRCLTSSSINIIKCAEYLG
jgi:hypothetical protein